MKKWYLNLKNVDRYAWFSKKVDLDLKMWTFYAWFTEKGGLNLKMWTFYAWFSEKCGPQPEEWGPFTHAFLKNVDLNLKNVDLYAWFSEKSGPQPENVDLLRMIFWKKWTSTWKCGPFTHDFLKKVDLNLKIVDLNAWGSFERGPQHEKCGPLCVIFEKRDLDLRSVDLYYVIFLNKNYLDLRNVVINT